MSSGENTFHEQVSLPNASEISGNNHLTTTTLNSPVGIIPQISNKRQMSDNSLSSDNLNETSTNEELGVPIKRVASSKGSTTSGKPRPHICPICTRAFARLEHLKRHERSHTNEKPFQCAACGRCFARRDLVLRHQQKLHASLPTNNRTNVQRKGKTPKLPPKDGEIVRDYLNDNINIVRNNTSAKLPIKHLNEDMPLTADSFNHPTNTTMSDHSMHNSSSISPVSDIANGNSNSNQSNKQIPSSNLAFNMGNQYLDNFSTTQKNQIDIFNSNLLNNGLMNNAIYNSPNSLNGLIFSPNVVSSNVTSTKPDNITPESQNHSSKLNQQQDKNDQQTGDDLMTQQKTDLDELDSDELDSDLEDRFNNYDHPQAMYEHDELQFNNGNNNGGTNPSDLLSSNYRNQRHASFSAAASSSYTGLPDTKIPHNKQMEELEKEAPQQVGFSSPQLTYKPNSELGGYLDLDLLDSLDLNDLGIDFSSFNYMQPSHNYHDGPNADNAKQPDDERQSVASPQEINLQRVLSNPSNGAALQRVLSHPRSGEALQKVLSHPNSDIALQKVLSHPQPNQILEKISKSDNTNWFNEFINAPIETNFPVISNHIGFTDTPDGSDSSAVANNAINAINSNTFFHNTEVSSSNTNDLKQLFRSRQIDLSKHIPHPYQNPAIPGRCSENVRDHIMKKYQLNQQQFPMLDDLNHYLALYEGEFSKYFPFIHIPSLKIDDNLDQIPLMLSMAAIGALYSFHARNSTTLFNFSRFLIHNFMESQIKTNQFHDIPLHITQSLVLHMFLGMFHNDHEITKLISRQLSSLVSLIKTTRLDLPLESLLLPPNISADLLSLPESANNVDLINSCFKYFILAQSRIRTIHVLHCLTVLYGCLTDSKVELSVDSIESGSPCAFEELWQAKNYDEWLSGLREKNLTISSKFSLIRLSNGPSYKELWRNLQNLSLDEDVGLRAMLSLLFSLNEFIHSESIELEKNEQKSDGVKVTEWRMEQRPYIESLIKIWESSYVRNRGILVPRGQNVHAINNSCVLKLTLPLLSFAKINKCVYISSVLSHVWTRNWEAMNSEVKKLSRDTEALRDSINYSLDIINLWTEIISINNDAEKTSIRTPIFFLTCLFTSTLLISEYLYSTEINAKKYLDESERVDLSTADRVIWLRAEKIFKKIEQNLLPIGSNNQSFSEFLRIQANGALDVDILDDEIARLALEPGDLKPIAEIILSGKLSVRCLSLGVRILADAPVWPVALLFAEALKARAIHINSNSK